tara:strand:+ start:132 stop:323 length:192 start_codon:yes stop_codon:yes gene_type:complete
MTETLITVYKREGRQSPIVTFEDAFSKLERIDQIELLISVEREVIAERKNITNEMFQYSKGKW